jgi:hypothetical protein
MSDDGARALASNRAAFEHLMTLDVSENCLGSEGVGAVETLCKNVLTDEQKSDGEDRYVSLSE